MFDKAASNGIILCNNRARRSRNPIVKAGSHARVRGQSWRKSCCRLDFIGRADSSKCRRWCRDISDTARASRVHRSKIKEIKFRILFQLSHHDILVSRTISLAMRHPPRDRRGGEGEEIPELHDAIMNGRRTRDLNFSEKYIKWLRYILSRAYNNRANSCHVTLHFESKNHIWFIVIKDTLPMIVSRSRMIASSRLGDQYLFQKSSLPRKSSYNREEPSAKDEATDSNKQIRKLCESFFK